MYKQLMTALLGQRFKDSNFNKLEVTNSSDGSHNVAMQGQTFGVVQAVCSAILALSQNSGIPTVNLIEFIICGVCMMEPQQEQNDELNSLIKHLEKCLAKQAEEK